MIFLILSNTFFHVLEGNIRHLEILLAVVVSGEQSENNTRQIFASQNLVCANEVEPARVITC
jgi:hypothetical protein